jgi:hypothetical protein
LGCSCDLDNDVIGDCRGPCASKLECEGPSAVTNEVLDAAEAIYDFLAAKGEDAGVEAGRRPN